MGGEADVAHNALGLQLLGDVVGPGLGILYMAVPVVGMEQVKIEVLHTALFQLLVEQGQNVRLGLVAGGSELVRQHESLPGMPLGDTFPDCQFALVIDVEIGGIKVIEAGFQEGIHHFVGGFDVHILADHGQAHHAEAEILFDFRKICVHIVLLRFFFHYIGSPEKCKQKTIVRRQFSVCRFVPFFLSDSPESLTEIPNYGILY